MTSLAAFGARAIPELVVLIVVAGVVALCVIIAAPLRQIARARQVAAVLGKEQEPSGSRLETSRYRISGSRRRPK